MAEPDVVTALEQLGFSLNESRAYHALLMSSPATGYDVSSRARIPRSAVYGVLRRLVGAGLARSIAGTPEQFAPAPPQHVVALLRKRFDQSAATFEDAVSRLDTTPHAPDAYSVRGYGRVLEEAERMILSAENRIVMSAWPRELQHLASPLRAADDKGVFIVLFSHAQPPELPGNLFTYGLAEADVEQFWKHRLVVVCDDRRSLIAAAEMTDADQGVISETAPIAEVATSQIALDVTLLAQRTGRDARPILERMLGERVGRLDSVMGHP